MPKSSENPKCFQAYTKGNSLNCREEEKTQLQQKKKDTGKFSKYSWLSWDSSHYIAF
jgi:hypothetical protein